VIDAPLPLARQCLGLAEKGGLNMQSVFRIAAMMGALASPAFGEPVTEFALDNGLQIVVIEDQRAPVVTQMVWYKTGRADEPAGQSGIAHFFEHLMFKGTDTVAPGAFSAIVAANGGSDNAFTSDDYTAYFQRVPADQLGEMMRLEADRMANLNLSPENVATELQVILEERGQRVDSDPSALFREQMSAAQYLNHPYGVPIIGWLHEMKQLNREKALDFYARHYAPNNAILVVAGDVDPTAVRDLAQTHYGPLKPSTTLPPRLRPSEPPQLAARRLTMADARVAQPYIMRSYLAPERNAGDQKQAAAITILAEVLGGSGTTSVLSRALQFDSQIAVYSGAGYSGVSVDPTTFSLIVVPSAGVSMADAEKALDETLAKFMETGVDPADLARIKTQLRAAEIYARDDAGDLARSYGAALAVGLGVQDVQDWPAALDAVTEADVMEAARAVLIPENSVTGWLETKATP
jgi:zinc protease